MTALPVFGGILRYLAVFGGFSRYLAGIAQLAGTPHYSTQVKILESNMTIEKQSKVELETENSNLRQKIDLLTHQLDPGIPPVKNDKFLQRKNIFPHIGFFLLNKCWIHFDLTLLFVEIYKQLVMLCNLFLCSSQSKLQECSSKECRT